MTTDSHNDGHLVDASWEDERARCPVPTGFTEALMTAVAAEASAKLESPPVQTQAPSRLLAHPLGRAAVFTAALLAGAYRVAHVVRLLIA